MIESSRCYGRAVYRGVVSPAVVLLFFLTLAGCGTGDSSPENGKGKVPDKAAPVKIEPVKKTTMVVSLALTGSVEAVRIAQLASPAEGPVLGVRVREGDPVRRGQVVVAIGRAEGAAALRNSLREELKKEDDNLARTRQLVESGAIPGEQLDIAVANSARVRAQLIKAREASGDYVVKAPWPGVVSKAKVRDGDFVAPRTPLVEIYDPASLIVQLTVPEQDVAAISRGVKAEIELDAYPGQRFSGRVTRLYPLLDPATRTRTAEITLTDPPVLLPGMFVRANLVCETIPDAITVPVYSLLPVPGGGFSVFVLRDGKAVRRNVVKDMEVSGRVRIVKGLNEGEKLIISGHEKLKEGAPVKPLGKGGDTGQAKGNAAVKSGSPGKGAGSAPLPENGRKQ